MITRIAHGTIVTASAAWLGDVLIDGERVVSVGNVADTPADLVIDATGKYVLPGGVDVHTHLDAPIGDITTADDFASGTIAAACGGTTAIVDYAAPSLGQALREARDIWMAKAEGNAVVDYGFHMTVTEVTTAIEREMDDLVREGITSFKVFMAYPGRLMLDDASIARALRRSRENGSTICIHAEDGAMIQALIRDALAAGHTAPRYHAVTRPPHTEVDATRRAIALAEQAGAPIYVVHVSTAGAAQVIADARRRGVPVYGETCPQYLFLSAECYDAPGFEGAKYVMSPPLRSAEMQPRLWAGLADDDLSVIATDHCPFTLANKALGRDDFSKIPNGAPGIETRLSLMFDGGVRPRRISASRFVDLTSTAPAKMFGMFPRKGTIAPGSDADLVVFDPEKRTTLSARTHHMRVDYNPYEGRDVVGAAETVLLRGRVIVQNGEFVGSQGGGRFIARAAREQEEVGSRKSRVESRESG